MKKEFAPKARKEDLVIQELDNEILIYDLNSKKALCLNESVALVWQACDGTKDISEIRKSLVKQLNLAVSDDFIWLALEQLKKENLIANKDEVNADFGGMSRREVIRKIGLTSVIALPVITGLVTPVAAQTASCSTTVGCTGGNRPSGCNCSNNNNCTSNSCVNGCCA